MMTLLLRINRVSLLRRRYANYARNDETRRNTLLTRTAGLVYQLSLLLQLALPNYCRVV